MEHLFSFRHPSNGRIQKHRERGRVLISGRLPSPDAQGLSEAHLYLEGQVQADLGDTAGVVPDPCSEASIESRESQELFGFSVPRKVYTVVYCVCSNIMFQKTMCTP